MRNRISIIEPDVVINQPFNTLKKINSDSTGSVERNNNLRILADEGCEDFSNYVDWLGLAKDPDLVVLSSVRHYYYDAEEMKNIKTLVNLKELNKIKSISSFIKGIFNILPERSYFIGCFVDNKRMKGYLFRNIPISENSESVSEKVKNGIVSRNPFLNMIYNKMDYRTYRYLSRNDVNDLLKNPGFKINDMTELSGITYFCSQRILPSN